MTPQLASVQAEVTRAEELGRMKIDLVAADGGKGPFGSDQALERLLQALGLKLGAAASGPLERLRDCV